MLPLSRKSNVKVIVVGSGPAGVSAAKGLLERGHQVTLLDVGHTLEPEKQILLQQVRYNNKLKIASLQYQANAKKKPKLPYGSNFVYKGVKDYFLWQTQDCYFKPSFAQGGLSNVWGGAIAEYSPKELSNWPAASRDLSDYYSQIIDWLAPYYTRDTSSGLNRQAVYLKNHWQAKKLCLEKNGFHFSTASLAMDFERCLKCGGCQYGCPHGFIYNSAIHLTWLKQQPHFDYINQVVVINFFEKNNQVELLVQHIKSKQLSRFLADYLFIACGSGLSSLLYLRALNQPGKELILKDSQHFVLPCLINKATKDIKKESLHTLCQLKANLIQDSISEYPIHLQFYTYMDLYYHEVKNKVKWVFPVVKPFLNSLLERLLVIQGYINSKESNQLSIQYQGSGNFLIKKKHLIAVDKTIHATVNYFKKHQHMLAFKPLRSLLHQSMVGQSNHIGGSLPMSDNPNGDKVDIWGKPSHFKRIHFVDGSILPSIPAGPITLTIMANAYRIAKKAPL